MKKHLCNCDKGDCPLDWDGQEIAFDHPDSNNFFDPTRKMFVATRNALHEFERDVIMAAHVLLFREAITHGGLDYLQTFRDKDGRRLWFIEDGQAITALLPEDY